MLLVQCGHGQVGYQATSRILNTFPVQYVAFFLNPVITQDASQIICLNQVF